MFFFYTVHKKPLREVEIAAICQDALQVSMLHQQSGIIKIDQIFVHCFVYLGHLCSMLKLLSCWWFSQIIKFWFVCFRV